MRHIIDVQAVSSEPDEYGTPQEVMTRFKRLRAEVIQQSAQEYIRSQGAVDETVMLFRVRNPGGITTAHRVTYQGETYNIRELAPIENGRGLEIRCVRLGGDA